MPKSARSSPLAPPSATSRTDALPFADLVADGPPLRETPHLVQPVRRGAERLVLKRVAAEQYSAELACLRAWASNPHVVHLAGYDTSSRTLLLARVDGVSLEDTWRVEDDDAATAVLTEAMAALQPTPPPAGVRHLREWVDYVRRPWAGIPRSMLDRAAGLADELFKSQTEPDVLLHGDLHHGNVLCAADGTFTVIDPGGVCGERGYEVGPLLYNPIPQLLSAPDPAALQRRRLQLCAERLGIDRDRLHAWGYVAALVSAAWFAEDADRDGLAYALTCARLLGLPR